MYHEPLGLLSGGVAAEALGSGLALPLAGGALAFTAVATHHRDARPQFQSIVELANTEFSALTAARAPWAGLTLARPRVMGVVNVTPDSFSDGGDWFDAGAAIAHGLALAEAGADILDVGGESARPGALPVDEAEERRRVVPVIKALADAGHLVSIDSRRAAVMAAAIDAGARILNDISALEGDAGSLQLAARSGLPVVLMHMRGEPRTMQQAARYDHVLLDVYDYLADRIAACVAAGIDRARIAIDPGIGFAKTDRHNLTILGHLGLFHGLGCPVLLGVSRKGFIGRHGGGVAPKDRLGGSIAAALQGVARGVQMVRVHDVRQTAQALAVWQTVAEHQATELLPRPRV